jgi:acetoacetate decarboxylase
MPLNNPSYPPGPYRFYDREYFVIEYLTDPQTLRTVVPEPLEISGPVVKFEFIRLPDTTGFGELTECGQMIPVHFEGKNGIFVRSMFLDNPSPIAAGREIWGFGACKASKAARRRFSSLPMRWEMSRNFRSWTCFPARISSPM